MSHLRLCAFTTAAALVSAAAAPSAIFAQTSVFYTPPKIVKQADTSVSHGDGQVRLKVFVHKDGSVGAVQVEKSSNHANDAAATDIAKHSSYKPGMRDAKPEDAYYTLVLKFSGSSVQAGEGETGDVQAATALIRAGNYAGAKARLQQYLGNHPSDASANVQLGVADSFLNDSAGAAAAFDAAGTVPDTYKTVAAKAYTDAALAQLQAKNNDRAIAYAQKAYALQQNVNTLYVEGTAYANAQEYPQSIAALEHAKALAAQGHADAASQNAIDASLAAAYLLGGDAQKGIALAKAVKQRDPSNTHIDDALTVYYNQRATAAMKAGKTDDAVNALEESAQTLPSHAAQSYVSAANVLAQGAKPDWKRVKAEADKAIAIDPNNARANFVAGIAVANSGDSKTAVPYLQKAKANAGSDTELATQVDAALKKLGVQQ